MSDIQVKLIKPCSNMTCFKS